MERASLLSNRNRLERIIMPLPFTITSIKDETGKLIGIA